MNARSSKTNDDRTLIRNVTQFLTRRFTQPGWQSIVQSALDPKLQARLNISGAPTTVARAMAVSLMRDFGTVGQQGLIALLDEIEHEAIDDAVAHEAQQLKQAILPSSGAAASNQTSPAALPPMATQPAPSRHPIYISYAWGEDDALGDALCTSLENDGYHVKRDKEANGAYKASIDAFMTEIGQGAAIIVVLSPKYLKSPFCMQELLLISRNLNFRERIFPIALPGTAIFTVEDRLECAVYWHERVEKLENLVKKIGVASFGNKDQAALRSMQAFKNEVGDMLATIADFNLLTIDALADNDFAVMKTAIDQWLAQLAPRS